MDTDINGMLFAEAGVWVGLCRFILFPLLKLRRRLPEDKEARTGLPFIPKGARPGIILAATGAAFLGVAYWQGFPLREALPAGWGAVGFAMAAFQAEESVRERRSAS